MILPKTTAPEEPLSMSDLRPHLGELNWQLRRIGMGLAVITSEDGTGVSRIALAYGTGAAWTVTCDECGMLYDPGRAARPTCPGCGIEVSREKVVVQTSR